MLSKLELSMYKSQKHNVEVNLINGSVIKGECTEFTNSLDNEPEVSSITVRHEEGLIEIYKTEISEIRLVN